MDWLKLDIGLPNPDCYQLALDRQQQLTKPPGSLGTLESLAARLAAMQETKTPCVDRVRIAVFAADHGIAAESVSAFPQSVTAEMVKNFANDGAAINVLARQINASLEIIDVGIREALPITTVISARAGQGTDNFLQQPAMTEAQLQCALHAGKSALERAVNKQNQLFIGGDMGIGNTTSASAVASALLAADPAELTGAGTGLDDAGIKRKTELIRQALSKHHDSLTEPLSVLQYLGGFEIAALCGAFLSAAQRQIPVLIDGFIASIASLVAVKMHPASINWFIYAHRSGEKGHQRVLDELQVEPLLDFNMRLGEGSGAALAVPLLRSACALHNEMATFAQAQVSEQ